MEDDDFARKVYCILGVPIDEIGMAGLVSRIHQAASTRRRLFISTPNLNYLMLSQRDPAFRHSLLQSDICPADGIGVLLICRLLGIPITARVAGADLPAALQAAQTAADNGPLRIAFFGGAPGVGERARAAVNGGDTDRLVCVAAIDPGVMTAAKMNDAAILQQVNATGADFLLVALGAQKGQAWLMGSRQKLTVPVVSHLGATLNFLAGTVRRAPAGLRRLGLEWLWRVVQEPYLAARYLSDGMRLLYLLSSRVAPLGLWLRWNKRGGGIRGLSVWLDSEQAGQIRVVIAGAARDDQLEPVVTAFRHAAQTGHGITLDVRGLQFFGMGFAGQVLMLEKAALKQKLPLAIAGATSSVSRAFKWCGLKHLLGSKVA
jgi:N-acetylglucosaminyldiphosphoundecaprenol N-acetyl-beta-D-mannosaminyltransferase